LKAYPLNTDHKINYLQTFA